MSDVAVSDLKGGHAPAQKVRFKVLQWLKCSSFAGWGDEGGYKTKGERERKACWEDQRRGRRGEIVIFPFLGSGERLASLSCISPGTQCMILYFAQIIRGFSGFPVFLPSIQNKFQILPVEDNWEKGVRQEFRPFSSEISSQVSRSALLDLIPSFFELGLPSLPPQCDQRCWKISLSE